MTTFAPIIQHTVALLINEGVTEVPAFVLVDEVVTFMGEPVAVLSYDQFTALEIQLMRDIRELYGTTDPVALTVAASDKEGASR